MQATTIRCDTQVLALLDGIAATQNRSRSWVINQALSEYVAKDTKRTQFKADVLASWQAYQDTGLHVTSEELEAWLETWGTPDEKPAPQCHR